MVILSRELLFLVVVSLFVALPIAYVAMDNWLASFAYRIDISMLTLGVAAGLSVGIAVLTVGIQAAKASRLRPTELLRV